MSDLLGNIIKSVALLEEYDAVPSRVEITRAQYDALRAQCYREGLLAHTSDGLNDSILGIKIVVKD